MDRPRKDCAFTLFELLLATVVTALTVMFVMQGFLAATTAWRAAESRTDTFRQARAALDCMVRDLQAVAPGVSGTTAAVPFLVLDYDPTTPQADRVNEEVYAVASLTNSGRSDLCMSGYRCEWDPASKTYLLKRRFKNSDVLFKNFVAAAGKGPPAFGDLYSRTTATEEELAACLWNLRFRPCVNQTAADYPRRSYNDPADAPRWIEIGFNALGSAAADKIKALPITRSTWSNNAADPLYRSAIQPGVQQFVVRVKLAVGNRQ